MLSFQTHLAQFNVFLLPGLRDAVLALFFFDLHVFAHLDAVLIFLQLDLAFLFGFQHFLMLETTHAVGSLVLLS